MIQFTVLTCINLARTALAVMAAASFLGCVNQVSLSTDDLLVPDGYHPSSQSVQSSGNVDVKGSLSPNESLVDSTLQPVYCEGLSAEACKRVTVVLESKIKPSYCAPGFSVAGNGRNLTQEQLRICYSWPVDPISPDEQRRIDREKAATEAKRQGILNDARAMLRQSWEKYRTLIASIELGFKCDVVEQFPADIAVRKIMAVMHGEQLQAGLIGDRVLTIEGFTTDAVAVGRKASESGACAKLTPVQRGQIRATVNQLMYQ